MAKVEQEVSQITIHLGKMRRSQAHTCRLQHWWNEIRGHCRTLARLQRRFEHKHGDREYILNRLRTDLLHYDQAIRKTP